MIIKLTKALQDRDLRHTAINQLWRLLSGPLLLLLVPLYLSAETQGYWYTFVSLAALAILADLGFSSIILLFSSHEYANLKFDSEKKLVGNQDNIIRLATLGKFAIKWSCTMAAITFPIVLIIGYYFLNSKDSEICWRTPWLIYGIASALMFINSMLLSFIEGCDSVGDIQKIRLYISVATVVVTGILLISGIGLYALAIALLCGSLTGLALTSYRYKNMLTQLISICRTNDRKWASEINPLIWRFAVSWISGYFSLSIFTPAAFHFYGAVEAGQVGLSIAICMAIFSISNIWITIVTPKINIFAAQNKKLLLNKTYNTAILLSITTYIIGVFVLFSFVSLVEGKGLIDNRLLPSTSLLVLSVGWLMQLLVNSMAVYMRAHKKEKLIYVSIANGLYVATSTFLISKFLPFDYFFVGFTSAYIIVLPWVYYIFQNFKKNRT
ncbi:hypothetical protein [Pseudomonas marginalis]|uniref:hypothetical protein n=2 Tax=Pseudomonas marginalis TaxID=298 RepID=UPI000AC89FEC|nr:hypothetical protein [Pseudomonas marginalis]